MTRFWFTLIACGIGVCLQAPAAAAQTPIDEGRTITNIRDGLYRVQDGDEVTVFLVTSEGIILVDPITPATHAWLRKEFETRFPDVRVRYVLFTSHEVHRASGGSTLDNTVETVAQERFSDERTRAATRLGTKFAPLDTNRDGSLQSAEFASSRWAAFIRDQDLNRDGSVTPGELYSRVPFVRRTFQQQLTITLGGTSVELRSVPVADAPDRTVVVFPSVRIAFAADLFPVRSIPERLGPLSTDGLVRSLRTVESLSVDSILTGQGETATVADVTAFREYVQDLAAGVRVAFADGRTLAEVQDSLSLDQHSPMANFATARRANIAEVYSRLRRSETAVFVAGAYVTGSADPNVCGPSFGCSLESTSWSSGILGARFSVGRIGFGGQVHANRVLTSHIPEWAFSGASVVQTRDTTFAFPISYDLGAGADHVSVSVEAGPSIVMVEAGQTVFGAYGYFSESRGIEMGWLAGATVRLRLTNRLAIVVPTYVTRGGSSFIGTRLLVGAGLSVGITRGVR